jgi:glycine/sarcosine/dimethylglycine N-methyltransferase
MEEKSENDDVATEVLDQNFGDDPVAVRQTNHYQEEYVWGFVEKWDELIELW